MIFAVFAVWLVLVLVLSNITTRLVTSSTSGLLFRLAIFPGVVVHELSHWTMCKLTGAKVFEVQLFGRQGGGRRASYGGHVTHGPSRLPLVGDPMISFAPVAGCLLALFLLTWGLGDPLGMAAPMAGAPADVLGDVSGVSTALWERIASTFQEAPRRVRQNAGDWRLWVYLYLAMSISVSLAPSKQDFQNSWRHVARHFAMFFLIGAGVFALLYYGGARVDIAWLGTRLLAPLLGTLAFTLSALLLALAVSALVWTAMRVVRR